MNIDRFKKKVIQNVERLLKDKEVSEGSLNLVKNVLGQRDYYFEKTIQMYFKALSDNEEEKLYEKIRKVLQDSCFSLLGESKTLKEAEEFFEANEREIILFILLQFPTLLEDNYTKTPLYEYILNDLNNILYVNHKDHTDWVKGKTEFIIFGQKSQPLALFIPIYLQESQYRFYRAPLTRMDSVYDRRSKAEEWPLNDINIDSVIPPLKIKNDQISKKDLNHLINCSYKHFDALKDSSHMGLLKNSVRTDLFRFLTSYSGAFHHIRENIDGLTLLNVKTMDSTPIT